MSDNHGWKRRSTVQLTCPSGVVVTVVAPGPELMLRVGRVARIYQKLVEGDDPLTLTEQLERMERLSDDEFEKLMVFARETVLAVVRIPRIVARPSPGIPDQIGPDDIDPVDFWFIVNWAQSQLKGLPVKVAGEDVPAEQVGTFPVEQGGSPATDEHSETEQLAGVGAVND